MPITKDPVKRERNSLRLFGCSEAEAIAINGGAPTRDPSSAAVRYLHQRTTAGLRGIEWAISFPEWMRIWLNSGHWADRGVGVGRYCMARHGDTGPYSATNVSIQLCTENSRDGIRKARPAMNANPSRRPGYGRGWTYRADAAKPYQVMVSKKYIGSYLAQCEAERAYRAAVAIHGIEARCMSLDSVFFA